jgi:hypothetical protein
MYLLQLLIGGDCLPNLAQIEYSHQSHQEYARNTQRDRSHSEEEWMELSALLCGPDRL